MGNEIYKPLPLVKEEFVEALTNLINSSPMPRFVIESILKDFYSDMKIIARKELEVEKKRYEEAINQQETE